MMMTMMVMVLLVGLASLTLLYQPLTDMLDVQQNDNNNLILIGCSSHDKTKDIEITTATNTNNDDDNSNENSEGPDVVWLMSFPNSGTSFTLLTIRQASNTAPATNYGQESKIDQKRVPSVQAINGTRGRNGPFQLLHPTITTVPSKFILTKTHCTGYFRDQGLPIHTVRTFMNGCRRGERSVIVANSNSSNRTKDEGTAIKLIPASYDANLVKKAIHLVRHPLDNIVARFHLARQQTKMFPNNRDGFQRWCAHENDDIARQDILQSSFLQSDRVLREKMERIPCRNEFFRYVQWHNLSFQTSFELDLPTMVLRYDEYAADYPKARDRVLDFLELERVDEGTKFHGGKTYLNYYTSEQKLAIRDFLQEFSSVPTWAQIKNYDFEILQVEQQEQVQMQV